MPRIERGRRAVRRKERNDSDRGVNILCCSLNDDKIASACGESCGRIGGHGGRRSSPGAVLDTATQRILLLMMEAMDGAPEDFVVERLGAGNVHGAKRGEALLRELSRYQEDGVTGPDAPMKGLGWIQLEQDLSLPGRPITVHLTETGRQVLALMTR